MLRKFCFNLIFVVFLGCSVFGQKGFIKEEYLKITPYVSTLEDTTKIYGDGDYVSRGRDDYLSITYEIDENKQVIIAYFRDCHQTDKPEIERRWVVDYVFFRFEKNLGLKPKHIFLNKKDFKRYLYGDVEGQILYINKDKNIRFTYLSNNKAVSSLRIMPTEENKQRYKCRKIDVEFELDPNQFRELDTN